MSQTVGEIQRAERLIHAIGKLADRIGGNEARFYRIESCGGYKWLPIDKVEYIYKGDGSEIHRVYHEGSVNYVSASAEELSQTYTMAELLAMGGGAT